MTAPHQTHFDSFVVLGEMRTGSNLLETNLNEFEGITCEGELYNPHFISHHQTEEFLGFSLADRERDPKALLAAIRSRDGLNGFRFFHDHDTRVLVDVLQDARCAKIVLTRNPIDSYVSLKIASATNQWKLGNVKHKRKAQVTFDGPEFEAHVANLQEFQLRIQRALQTSGQTAYYISYDDLNDVEILNGLARWLGVNSTIKAPSTTLKKQNPEPLEQKLTNPSDVSAALARLDLFNLTRTPNFEPRRGPMVPTWRIAAKAPLLYMPIKGGPDGQVMSWLAAIDEVERDDLPPALDIPTLKHWQRNHTGARSFTVLRHPLARAHEIFVRQIIGGDRAEVRNFLKNVHGAELPAAGQIAEVTPAQHYAGFLAFLQFIRANLSGQTSIDVAPAWASQTALLQGFAQHCTPDYLLRETTLAADLAFLAEKVGRPSPALPALAYGRLKLVDICDTTLQAAARDAYARDFLALGFGLWAPE
jgi:LPS sulfotransferase NodH